MCMHRRYAKTALVTHLIAIVSVNAAAEALKEAHLLAGGIAPAAPRYYFTALPPQPARLLARRLLGEDFTPQLAEPGDKG